MMWAWAGAATRQARIMACARQRHTSRRRM